MTLTTEIRKYNKMFRDTKRAMRHVCHRPLSKDLKRDEKLQLGYECSRRQSRQADWFNMYACFGEVSVALAVLYWTCAAQTGARYSEGKMLYLSEF